MRDHHVPLAAFIAGDLDPETTRRVDEHLLTCDPCWVAVREDRVGRAAAVTLRAPADTDLADRIRLAVELAPQPPRIRRSGNRWTRRGSVTATGVLALVLGVLTVLTLTYHHTARRVEDSAAVRQIVTLAQRLPTHSTPSPRAVEIRAARTLRVGGSDITVRTYAYNGHSVLVATADHPFAMPRDARMPTGRTMPWSVTRRSITLYCPQIDVLIAGHAPQRQLASLAAALHLT